ncbi:transporter substrate-binding domain-containing protein [Streptosporangium sp. NPDC051022]|uniref:transporter substrate-binding domain-containing protein n=1 Tax=Streptosporangium sp. NPDC051022 TaxID=3155752 RepID=UPI0034499CCA
MTEEPEGGETQAEDQRPDAEERGPQPDQPEPDPPSADPPFGRGRSRRVRRLRLSAWIALVLAAVVVVTSVLWVNGPPTEDELREQAGLFGKETLRIGVKDDTPGVALRDRKSGVFTGFDIEIAYMIATYLGYTREKVVFVPIETEDRARMGASDPDGKVDLVVATFSSTEARRKDPSVGLSTPYFSTEQSVVTRSGHPKVTSLEQLAGKKVCTLGTSTSEAELEKATKAIVTGVNRISECIDGLKNGDYDAVTTDAALLAGFVVESRKDPDKRKWLVHHDIALEKNEMWAVNAGPNKALRTLVEIALYQSYADPKNQRWERAFDRYIRPMMSVGSGVAQTDQPCVPPPQVRRWPWQRALSVDNCLSP